MARGDPIAFARYPSRMTTRDWLAILAYGALAALMLGCFWLVSLAPLRLPWGRELVGAVIAIVAMGVGLSLSRRPRQGSLSTTPPPDASATGLPHAPDPAAPDPAAPDLSPREQTVLRLLGQGLSNKELARELSVSENTIKTHLANLYAKLGVGRRTEALAAARRWRIPGHE
jgi:DNA-binding CsgD family transcriptional regulator